MRVLIQRAAKARVLVDEALVGELPRPGLVCLVGVTHSDTSADASALAAKVWRMRILADEKSAADVDAPLLVVSQFTLYANTKKGRRPSWNQAAPANVSEPLVADFVAALRELGATVATGEFGANMQVELTNDGPVTIWLDSQNS